jgi:hypothetical protein
MTLDLRQTQTDEDEKAEPSAKRRIEADLGRVHSGTGPAARAYRGGEPDRQP